MNGSCMCVCVSMPPAKKKQKQIQHRMEINQIFLSHQHSMKWIDLDVSTVDKVRNGRYQKKQQTNLFLPFLSVSNFFFKKMR